MSQNAPCVDASVKLAQFLGMHNKKQHTGLAGIEPTAYRLGGDRSILLSYSPKQHLILLEVGSRKYNLKSLNFPSLSPIPN